jgi:hypothetical protein
LPVPIAFISLSRLFSGLLGTAAVLQWGDKPRLGRETDGASILNSDGETYKKDKQASHFHEISLPIRNMNQGQ